MPAGSTAVVLDAWPVLERYAGNEPSVTAIESLLSSGDTPAIMSAVNFGEVHSSLLRDRGPEIAERDTAWLRQLLVLEPATVELAAVAAASNAPTGCHLATPSLLPQRCFTRHPCGPATPSCYVRTEHGRSATSAAPNAASSTPSASRLGNSELAAGPPPSPDCNSGNSLTSSSRHRRSGRRPPPSRR